jgi:hypothetical protein
MVRIYPLRDLRSRASNDPAIAMLDAWATIADVLTFYQERIANEGYLRTAIERRSILELARLVGYFLRPGVASSVYLAYTLENGYCAPSPPDCAPSVPAPGEQAHRSRLRDFSPASGTLSLPHPSSPDRHRR